MTFACLAGCHGGADAGMAGRDGSSGVTGTGGGSGGSDGGAADGIVAERPNTDGQGATADSGDGADGNESPDAISPSGDASTDVSGSCFGVCFEAFLATCPEAGFSCTTQITGNQTNTCYENGVKTSAIVDGSVTMETVKNAQGGICNTLVLNYPSEDIMGPDGNLIAHIDFSNHTAFTLTCRDPSGATSVTSGDLQSTECMPYEFIGADCAIGTCAF